MRHKMNKVPMFEWFVQYHIQIMEARFSPEYEAKSAVEPKTVTVHKDTDAYLDDFVSIGSKEELFQLLETQNETQNEMPDTYKVIEGNMIAKTRSNRKEIIDKKDQQYPSTISELYANNNPVDTIKVERMQHAPKHWAKISRYENDKLAEEFSFKLDHETKTIKGVYRKYENNRNDHNLVFKEDNINLGIDCVHEPMKSFSDNLYDGMINTYNSVVEIIKEIPSLFSTNCVECKAER